MIDDDVRKLLTGPAGMFLGSRDANNHPNAHRVWGCRIDQDGKRVTAFIARGFDAGLRTAVDDNGEVALTAGHPVSHETYQVKGRCVTCEAPNDEDLAAFEKYRAMMMEALAHEGYPQEVVTLLFAPPEVALTFEVREIFLQTPGPEAGTRIAPEGDR